MNPRFEDPDLLHLDFEPDQYSQCIAITNYANHYSLEPKRILTS